MNAHRILHLLGEGISILLDMTLVLVCVWLMVLAYTAFRGKPSTIPAHLEPAHAKWDEIAYDDVAVSNAHGALVEGRYDEATYWLKAAFEPDLSEYRADEYRKWLEGRVAA